MELKVGKTTAEIILDSKNGDSRLTTFLLRYPRMIHAELMTHRMFSRNASSSRAIPAKKMLDNIANYLFVPLKFQKPHKGMQGTEYHEGESEEKCKEAWLHAASLNLGIAKGWTEGGEDGEEIFTKQLINRITEPYSYITVLVSATNYSNWFGLRRHEAAEIHIQELANKMWDVYSQSTPQELKHGEWHLPFITEEEKDIPHEDKVTLSLARSAWTSYRTPDGQIPSLERCRKIVDQLFSHQPIHASPAEHVAQAVVGWNNNDKCGNFDKNWVQYRKTMKGEMINPEELTDGKL